MSSIKLFLNFTHNPLSNQLEKMTNICTLFYTFHLSLFTIHSNNGEKYERYLGSHRRLVRLRLTLLLPRLFQFGKAQSITQCQDSVALL